ncbi:hypothetical protein [Paenibacillus alkalitolerans]|uniref:hypothetical protein n=1 Tax=Paenibacillus alkalitolerans TaxID=2799335 RepID=UPI0018F78582|nr:hypothetical protein [Paenibacillus alkalitolerans]
MKRNSRHAALLIFTILSVLFIAIHPAITAIDEITADVSDNTAHTDEKLKLYGIISHYPVIIGGSSFSAAAGNFAAVNFKSKHFLLAVFYQSSYF